MSFVDAGGLVFHVILDSDQLPAAAENAKKRLGALGQGAAVGGKAVEDLGKQSKASAFQVQQLSNQVQDFVVQVQAGTNPLTAFIQQGSQVAAVYGGFGNALKGIASLITPARLGLAGLALSGAAAALAFIQGRRESDALAKSIAVTGNFAGQTAVSFDELARSVASSSNTTIGTARGILQQLIATGQVGPQALRPAAEAIATLSKLTGQSADEAAKDLATLFKDPAKGAEELNRRYHFLNAEQFIHIRNLQTQGDADKAAAFAADELNRTLVARKPPLNEIGRLWEEVGKKASAAWDAMLGIGRAETLADKLVNVQRVLEATQARGATPGTEARDRLPGTPGNIAALQERLRDLSRQGLREFEQASAASGDAKKNEDEIARKSASFQDSLLAIDKAGFDRRQALADFGRQRDVAANERQFERLNIGYLEYTRRRTALENAAIAAHLAAVDKDVEIERKRVIDGVGPQAEQQRNQQQAKIVALEARRVAILQERIKLQREADRFFGVDRRSAETPRAAFRASELGEQNAAEGGLSERSYSAAKAFQDLRLQNKRLGAELILDETKRAQALLEIETEEHRKRLGIEVLTGDARKDAEEAFAQWRVLREQQLTEELKPEYKRQLELFADTTRYMRQWVADFHKGFIDSGREAFEQWVTTGKLSIAGLVQFAEAQLARLFYNRFIAPAVDSGATALLAAIGLSHSGGMAGASGHTRAVSPLLLAGAPRLHRGGLAADEVPRILLKNEEVLTRDDPRHVMNGGRRGGAEIHLHMQTTFNGGVTRNDLANGMVFAIDTAVNKVADLKRRGSRAY
jgi:phage-related minor tail protein